MKTTHWDYYRVLVDDIDRISRYVEIVPDNFAVYSIELVRMILAAGSEVDVVAKRLCQASMPPVSANNINEYRSVLCEKYPGLPGIKATMPRHGYEFVPWEEWANGENPAWWRAYNSVKHQRDQCFAQANLKNTIDTIAGLCVLVTYLYKDVFETTVMPTPMLFVSAEYKANPQILFGNRYKLPDFV
ncbi:MAG: hypothetical protein JW809_13135 [Pirellulales bacterium]|nr:hypothetical protein [Pirellulales bacterium]